MKKEINLESNTMDVEKLGMLRTGVFIIENYFKELNWEVDKNKREIILLRIKEAIDSTKKIKEELGFLMTDDGQIAKWDERLKKEESKIN